MVVQVQRNVNIELFLFNCPRAPAFLTVKSSNSEFSIVKVNDTKHSSLFILCHLVQFYVLVRFASKLFLKSNVLTLEIVHHNKEFKLAIFHNQNSPCGIFGELATDNRSVRWHESCFDHILKYILVVDEPVVRLHNDLFILVIHHGDSKVLVKSLLLSLVVSIIRAFLRFVIVEESDSGFESRILRLSFGPLCGFYFHRSCVDPLNVLSFTLFFSFKDQLSVCFFVKRIYDFIGLFVFLRKVVGPKMGSYIFGIK